MINLITNKLKIYVKLSEFYHFPIQSKHHMGRQKQFPHIIGSPLVSLHCRHNFTLEGVSLQPMQGSSS